jgi:hypothetical protein
VEGGLVNVTLDMGCIADLQDDAAGYPYLRSLIKLHERQLLTLRVVAIGASERHPDGIFAADFPEFAHHVERAGLGQVEILEPVFRWGLTFADWSLWPDAELESLERRIHEVLYRRLPFCWTDASALLRSRKPSKDSGRGRRQQAEGATGAAPSLDVLHARWRQARCEVLSMWAHIRYDGDIFVTRNDVYWQRDNRERLIRMGAGDILTPQGTLTRFADHLYSL